MNLEHQQRKPSILRLFVEVCRSPSAWAAIAGLVAVSASFTFATTLAPAIIVLPFAILVTAWYVSFTFVGYVFRRETQDRRIDGPRRSDLPPGAKSEDLFNPKTALLNRWYFEERLDEELSRALRYEFPLAIVTFRLAVANRWSPHWLRMMASLGAVSGRLVRQIDFAASLGDSTYAFCLPHTDEAGATQVADRIASEFANYSFTVGVAFCPADGRESERLLSTALGRMAEYEESAA